MHYVAKSIYVIRKFSLLLRVEKTLIFFEWNLISNSEPTNPV